jgi:hypothetical protein
VESIECRKRLAELARNPATRFVGGPPDRRSKWYPHEVPDAEGFGMTDHAAWELIADVLEDATQVMQTITLHLPKGAPAFVFIISVPQLTKRIYIKFEILVPSSGQKICGRSFHFAKY